MTPWKPWPFGVQRHLVMNGQFRRLGPLGGTRPLAALWLGGLRRARLQPAGSDLGTRVLSLEQGDLVTALLEGRFELLDAIMLDAEEGEETLDQRRALRSRDVGQFELHTAECTKTSPDQLRLSPHLLSSYGTLS